MMSPLEDLFPSGICCVFSDRPPDTIELPSAEAEAARTMRPARRREFAHGRACAREALDRLGFPEYPLPVGEDRAPIWPESIVGSISHSGEYAAAVATQKSRHTGLGVDLEVNEPLDPPLLPMLCRPEELAWLSRTEANRVLAKSIFSAKESVFKCIWPTVRRFVDFQEIEIRMDVEAGSFSAIPHSEDLPRDLIDRVHGRFAQTRELIITATYTCV